VELDDNMCGFIGLIGDNQKGLREEGFRDILHHRGPDNVSVIESENVAFIHNRLSIIDLSSEANQPMIDPDTGNILVFNGEIYNYVELKKKYNQICWKTQSDVEVLLKLYGHMGKRFVEELNGIFAFAIYDKTQNKLLLYRDRFGVKPIYYMETGEGLVFSSEIKAILRVHPRDINLRAVYDYLEFGKLAHNRETFFEEIYALEAAHLLEYDLRTGSSKKTCYWDVPFDEFPVEIDEQEAVEKTYDALKDAVRLNMVSDVEVAISLSSGTDSTLILKLAQEHTDKLRAFTFGFDEGEYDEVRRIKEQGLAKDIKLCPTYLKQNQMLPKLKEALYYFETPLGGVGTLAAYNMMAEASDQGVKVLLSGEGSDETFGGYKYYYPAFFKDIEENEDLLSRELEAYSVAHGHKVASFSREYEQLMGLLDHETVLAPDATSARESHASGFLKNAIAVKDADKAKSFSSNLQRVMYADLAMKKLPKLLHFQDRAGMANSIEVRVPFLDHRLVSFLYNLPGTFKIRNGQGKYLIKKILKDVYGYMDNKKTKHYVSTPQREWMKSKSACEEILDTVKGGKLKEMNLIDYKRFENDYLKYAVSPELGNSFFAWKVINLEYLMRQKWT